MREKMIQCVESAQKQICAELNQLNENPCVSHPWKSKTLQGGGAANIFKGGKFLEKGGVNVSTVRGKVFGEMTQMMTLEQKKSDAFFFATGISLVLHPRSPWVPTVHANYRYFEIESSTGEPLTWFFGGGADLTPYYLFEEDAVHFHHTLKNACDKTDPTLYPQLKKDADSYFYLPHRKEHRGVGGIFSLKMTQLPQEACYQWARDCSEALIPSYLPLVKRRMQDPYTEAQKEWQLIRRGRYVEFNLLYDLGTHFGLKSGGETENILMSLPPEVRWEFQFEPKPGSPEDQLMQFIRQPKDWI